MTATMKGYTTEALVEGELLTDITASTTPTSNQLSYFIAEAEGEIDELTESSYTQITVSNEIIPFDNTNGWLSGYAAYPVGRTDSMQDGKTGIFLTYNGIKVKPILSITSLYKNNSGQDSISDSWEELTEQTGSGGDFIVDKQTGFVTFVDNKPIFNHKRSIKASFKYGGTSTIPSIVQTLATKMVARRVLVAKVMKSQMSSIDDISLESISITKGANKTVSLIKNLDEEIERLKNRLVGTFKTDIV